SHSHAKLQVHVGSLRLPLPRAEKRLSWRPRPTVDAPFLLHMPVNRLHLIELQWDAVRRFLLTPAIKGVETLSFFGNFCSFPGWCGVRGSSQVTSASQDDGGRQARVYSKALVEANRKIAEGRIEFRGVGLVCPVGGKPGARAQIAHCSPQG